MNVLKIISSIGYSFVALAGLVLGTVYSFAAKIMPYHLQAMNSSWDKLEEGIQWMLFNFQRSVAAGFITTSITLIFLLLFPFRKNELWSYFALFVIAMIEWGNIASRTVSVKIHTDANPPLGALIVLLSIIVVSFIISLISYKTGGVR